MRRNYIVFAGIVLVLAVGIAVWQWFFARVRSSAAEDRASKERRSSGDGIAQISPVPIGEAKDDPRNAQGFVCSTLKNLSEPGATLVSFASGRTVSNPSRSPAVSPRKGLGAFVHRQKDLDAYLKGLGKDWDLAYLADSEGPFLFVRDGRVADLRGGGQITLGYDEMDAKLGL